MKGNFIMLFVFLFSMAMWSFTIGQEKQEITLSEFILLSKKSDKKIQNLVVKYQASDSVHYANYNSFLSKEMSVLEFPEGLTVKNVKFELPENKPIEFKIANGNVSLLNCDFSCTLFLNGNASDESQQGLFIDNCNFNKSISIGAITYLYVFDSSFGKYFKIYGSKQNLHQAWFQRNQFGVRWKEKDKDKDPMLFYLYTGSDKPLFEIAFDSCYFNKNSPDIYDVVKFEGSIERLKFTNSYVNYLDISSTNISNSLLFHNNEISSGISIEHTDISPENFIIPWEQIKNHKLCIIPDPYRKLIDIPLNSSSNFSNIDPIAGSQLLSSYKKLNNLYKARGELHFANASLVELKDFETARLKYLYETRRGTQNFLNWQLNIFLKFFAEYGTNPIRSLVVSFYVVLIFSIFYFFTRTDWDNINRKYLVKQSESIMEYFTSEQKLEDFYSNAYKEDLIEYKEFKSKIAESQAKIPFFFILFLKPLYFMTIIKHKLNTWIYRRMEILSGRWVDLTKTKKVTVGTIVALASIFYLGYLFVVRSLNSIILSINTFSTLGFGDIPVKGFMRYVAIMEGFLGWFLLSIFSVSLISQILQS